MLGLTFGELFVAAFITVAIVSAPLWPRAGGAVARALFAKGEREPPKR